MSIEVKPGHILEVVSETIDGVVRVRERQVKITTVLRELKGKIKLPLGNTPRSVV